MKGYNVERRSWLDNEYLCQDVILSVWFQVETECKTTDMWYYMLFSIFNLNNWKTRNKNIQNYLIYLSLDNPGGCLSSIPALQIHTREFIYI